MENKFWIEEKSPKELYKEFMLSGNPKASFWDIFESYEIGYSEEATAGTDPEWLKKQEEIIDAIIKKHFAQTKLNTTEIEQLIEAVEEYTMPEEEQYTEDLDAKFKEVAQRIAKEHIVPLKLKQSTANNLVYALEDKLEEINKNHIINWEIEQSVRLYKKNYENGIYTKEQYENIIKSLVWNSKNSEEDDFEDDEDKIEVNDFNYPTLPLAFSITFYDFDGDDLLYEEQEKFSLQKFKQYEAEISELLHQKPDENLAPKAFDFENDEAWNKYFELSEQHPFIHEFDGVFSIWKNKEKVLFLTLNREDKELPFEINIGGLTLAKYEEMLTMYNTISKTK